jgi:hypothetical protein
MSLIQICIIQENVAARLKNLLHCLGYQIIIKVFLNGDESIDFIIHNPNTQIFQKINIEKECYSKNSINLICSQILLVYLLKEGE